MQIEEIVQRVKAEARVTSAAAPASASGAEDRKPQPALAVKDSYHVREFLAIDNEALVVSVYRCLLKRAPDPSAGSWRQKLALGLITPVEFVGRVRFSAEGRSAGVRVEGLLPPFAFCCLQKIPVLGFLLTAGMMLVRLPALQKEISLLRDDVRLLHRNLAALTQQVDRLEAAQEADRTALARHAAAWEQSVTALNVDVQACRDAVRYGELAMHRVHAELQAMLDDLGKTLPPAPQQLRSAQERLAALAAEQHDKLYLDFESLYRGTQLSVANALHAYAELLEPLRAAAELPKRAIDLGSGRGEMLGYLGRLGFDATGVDLNRVAVGYCEERDLKATCEDALAYLENLEPQSVAVITSLHMVEHLAPRDLFRLLQAALRVLAPGGLLLLETPNPRNLLVGAGDFYRDFTHTKPLFPDTLKFLLDHFGYADAGAFFFADAASGERRLVPSAEVRFEELDDYLRVSRDYAVAGYKACA